MTRISSIFTGAHAMSHILLPCSVIMVVVLLFSVSGCGKKTLPVPPMAVLPRPVIDLAYQGEEKGIILSWSRPDLSEGGVRLDKVEEFELLKAEYPVVDFCEGCPLNFSKVISVRSFVPKRFGAKESKVIYRDQDLRPGYRYFYKVRSMAGWRIVSKDSNLISFNWPISPVPASPVVNTKVIGFSPPEAPRDLIRIKIDKGIKLFWSLGPTRDIAGYRIYRRLDKAQKAVLLDSVSAYTLNYLDEHPPDEETVWYYSITAIDQEEPPNESPPSPEVRYEVVK